jgi:hypothetical protein
MKSLFTFAFCCLVTVPSVFILSIGLSLFWTAVISLFFGFAAAIISNLVWDALIEPWMEDDGN